MNWRRATGAIAATVPLIALLAWGMTRDPSEIPSPLPGRPAPQFALAVFTPGNGAPGRTPPDTIRLASLRGDVVVLNYWASWCLACREEHQALGTVAQSFVGAKDVHFVGMLFNDQPANGMAWLDRMGPLPYPALDDPGARTAIAYGVYGVPETYFIGRDGRVAYKHTGPITEDVLLKKIAELRAEPRPGATGGAATTAAAPSTMPAPPAGGK